MPEKLKITEIFLGAIEKRNFFIIWTPDEEAGFTYQVWELKSWVLQSKKKTPPLEWKTSIMRPSVLPILEYDLTKVGEYHCK